MEDISRKNYPFTENLLEYMKRNDVSEEELSEKSGIAIDDLRKILRNRKVVGLDEMVLLAKALQTDMNTLFAVNENA